MLTKRISSRPLWFSLAGLACVQVLFLSAQTGIWFDGHAQLNDWLEGTLEEVQTASEVSPSPVLASSVIPASAPVASAPLVASTAAVAASSANVSTASACLEFPAVSIGKNKERLEILEKAWKEAGLTVTAQTITIEDQPVFWIHSPPRLTHESAEAKQAEVTRLGVKTLGITAFGKAPNRQYLVSLGRFGTRAEAEKYLATLREKGVKTALLSVLDVGPQARLQLKTADPSALKALLEMQWPNQNIQSCQENPS